MHVCQHSGAKFFCFWFLFWCKLDSPRRSTHRDILCGYDGPFHPHTFVNFVTSFCNVFSNLNPTIGALAVRSLLLIFTGAIHSYILDERLVPLASRTRKTYLILLGFLPGPRNSSFLSHKSHV